MWKFPTSTVVSFRGKTLGHPQALQLLFEGHKRRLANVIASNAAISACEKVGAVARSPLAMIHAYWTGMNKENRDFTIEKDWELTELWQTGFFLWSFNHLWGNMFDILQNI